MQLNSFTCSNGHTFTANAKLRARCSECGVMTRRPFNAKPIEDKVEDKVVDKVIEDKIEDKKSDPPKGPRLIRQGKLRQMPIKKPAPKSTGKVSGGIVKTKKLVGKTSPKINVPPKRTAIARHIKVPHLPGGKKQSFLEAVMERYGPNGR